MSKEKVKLRIEPLGKELLVNKGTPLKDIVFQYGIEFPCGGEGYCGGCKVKILSGDVKDSEKHEELNYKLGLEDNYRLACISKVSEDLVIEIPQLETIILTDNSIFSFEPKSGFGVAVDLGTTTLVAQLVDLSNGHVIGVQTSRNPQSKFGSDIMSRILHGMTEEGGKESKKIIREEIYSMIQELIKNKNVKIEKVIIVGNTVMHHLFCGFDVTPLSKYPFETEHKESIEYSSTELGWELIGKAKIVFIRPIASFIGSDILAGIVASGMNNKCNFTSLIDLGTNGEIVVGCCNKILCASTAAGPAFEGANIEMGMSAMSGAISSIDNHQDRINYHAIGNQEPIGICGSGLIDAIKVFIEKGEIDLGGAIVGNNEKLMISDKVYITQKDIREFQLAKAAIAAGLQILVNKLDKNISEVTRILIAGGFGNFINVKNIIDVGMLEVRERKIKKLGNSALIGAKMMLFYDDYSFDEIIGITEHVSLDADKDFQEIFVDKMFFSELVPL
jgi:uncharacterized 2Fe-2S/4Fe-4S cluster protein (DUF4445 family)